MPFAPFLNASSMRLLWLKYGELLPPDTGGKLRSYHLLRALRTQLDLRMVSYVRPGVSPGYAAALADELPGARVLEIEGIARGILSAVFQSTVHRTPLTVSRFTSSRVRSWLEREIAGARPDLLLCDFLMPSDSLPRDLRIPTVLFQHNVEASLWQRKAAAATGAKAMLYRWEHRALARYEAAVLGRFDAILSVSPDDKRQFEAMSPGARVAVAETGVDIAAFVPPPGNVRSAVDVVFVGSMDWQPNIQGVQWFVETIWPDVVAACPDAVFHVVGRRPPAAIRRLESPQIRVTGDVASVRPHLNSAAVSVVPLLAGGGTRLKIYEAMAAGAPVLSTTVGAEGLDVVAGRDIVLADTPAMFSIALIELLRDARRRDALSTAGLQSVAAKDWTAVARGLVAFLEDVRAQHGSTRG